MNALLLALTISGTISGPLYDQLRSVSQERLPKFVYELPNIHKLEIPLHPIASSVGSPNIWSTFYILADLWLVG